MERAIGTLESGVVQGMPYAAAPSWPLDVNLRHGLQKLTEVRHVDWLTGGDNREESIMVAQRWGQTAQHRQPPFTREDFARDVAPLVAASAVTAAGIATLWRGRPAAALKAARFVNLLLASLLTGNGVGGERFVHAPLKKLAPDRFLEAEQAITRSYLPMIAVMPASILSGILVLAFLPQRRGAAFWLTIGGTLCMAGIQATTLAELPLNRQTLEASPKDPSGWLAQRGRWNRFNHLRTGLAIVGWSCLCLAALTEDEQV